MIADTTIFGLSLAEIAVAVAVAGLAIEKLLDHIGWSRSSKTLRRENEDLVRRNTELEPLVGKVQHLESQVEALTNQVGELQKRDQAAVLAAIETHERNAGARAEAVLGKLGEIRDALNR